MAADNFPITGTRTAPVLSSRGLPAPAAARAADSAANGGIGQTLLLPLPEVTPIPDAQFFFLQGTKNTVVAESNKPLPGVDFTLEAGLQGVIDSVVFSVQNLLPTSALTFSLLFNQNKVQGFVDVAIFPATAALYQLPWHGTLRVPENTRVQALYTNGDGGTYLVGVDVTGWFWPVASGRSWIQSGVAG